MIAAAARGQWSAGASPCRPCPRQRQQRLGPASRALRNDAHVGRGGSSSSRRPGATGQALPTTHSATPTRQPSARENT